MGVQVEPDIVERGIGTRCHSPHGECGLNMEISVPSAPLSVTPRMGSAG